MLDIDFERLFARLPNPYMLLDRELRYVAANESYLQVTASRLEDLLGRRITDAFPNDPSDPNNLPARMLRESLERVLTTGETDTLALIPYRVPAYRNGAVVEEDRFWSAIHLPITDAQGKVTYILQHTVDVTELERLRRGEGVASAADTGGLDRMGASVLSRAEAMQEANQRLDRERQRLQALFEQAPGFMSFVEGPELVYTLSNRASQRLVDNRSLLGRPARQALPELAGQGFFELMERVLTTGEVFVGQDVRVVIKDDAGQDKEVFVDFVYQPVRDDAGRVTGIFTQGHDVTERKAAEREREAALRAAEAFSSELVSQSQEVKAALDAATRRIAELEAELARRS